MPISVFTILGRVAYSAGGRLCADWEPKLQAIVGALLIQLGRPISRQQLADWVWDGNRMPSDLAATMHTYANRIKRRLERADGTATLVTRNGYFRIDAAPDLVDYHLFRASADQARIALNRNEPQLALDTALTALSLWQQEEPLAGLTSTMVDNRRRRLITDEWVPAQDTVLAALLDLGEFRQALVRIDDVQREHPSEFSFIKRRIQALHGLGRVEDATGYYLTQRKALRERGEDVAVRELLQLHERSLRRPEVGTSTLPKRAARRRLPLDLPTFVGRETYLAKLDAMTRAAGEPRPSIVVLDGQAGVGKTALALHWAHRLDRDVPVFYYDLQGVGPALPHEADEVVDELLAALDYPVERLVTAAQRRRKLADLLAERPMVVILDNVRNSEHVRGVLPVLADCTVLLTSRQRLTGLRTLHHAVPLSLAPMATAQGATLLARVVGRRAADAPHLVTTLAQLSGGLPMALQVIAHHVERHPHVPLAEITDDLRDATTLLGIGEDGDTPAPSLRASFAMSYDTLSPFEQDLFATLALHPGHDISLAAAAALTGQPTSVVRTGLNALEGAHMVELAGGSIRRYRQHDLIRSFGAERALTRSVVDNDRAQLRLLSWYLHSSFRAFRTMFPNRLLPRLLPLEPGVTPLDFTTERQADAWLVDERDNLLDLITWSRKRHPSYADRLPSALYRTLRQYGHYAEARQALTVAIEAAHILGEDDLEAGSRHDLGQILLAMGDVAAANREFVHAAGLAKLAGEDVGIATSTYSLAEVAIRKGQFDEAIQLCHQALVLAKSGNLVEMQAAILLRLGKAYRRKRARTMALPCFEQALWLAGSLRDSHMLIETLIPLAEMSSERGDHSAAQAHGNRALDLVIARHDLEEAPAAFLAVARVNSALDKHKIARDHAREALRYARQRHNVQVEADALDVLATSLAALRQVDGAREAWELAREIHLGQGRPDRAESITGKIATLPEEPDGIPIARTNSTDNVGVSDRSVEH